MISAKTIKDRLAWADTMTEAETVERFAVLLTNELQVSDGADRLSTAMRRALHRLRTETWRAAAMAFVGADADGGVHDEG